jgi:hypothetical protein
LYLASISDIKTAAQSSAAPTNPFVSLSLEGGPRCWQSVCDSGTCPKARVGYISWSLQFRITVMTGKEREHMGIMDLAAICMIEWAHSASCYESQLEVEVTG